MKTLALSGIALIGAAFSSLQASDPRESGAGQVVVQDPRQDNAWIERRRALEAELRALEEAQTRAARERGFVAWQEQQKQRQEQYGALAEQANDLAMQRAQQAAELEQMRAQSDFEVAARRREVARQAEREMAELERRRMQEGQAAAEAARTSGRDDADVQRELAALEAMYAQAKQDVSQRNADEMAALEMELAERQRELAMRSADVDHTLQLRQLELEQARRALEDALAYDRVLADRVAKEAQAQEESELQAARANLEDELRRLEQAAAEQNRSAAVVDPRESFRCDRPCCMALDAAASASDLTQVHEALARLESEVARLSREVEAIWARLNERKTADADLPPVDDERYGVR